VTTVEMAPTPLEQLLGLKLSGCGCGKTHTVPTQEALLQPGALQQLPALAARCLPPGAILCIADTNKCPCPEGKAPPYPGPLAGDSPGGGRRGHPGRNFQIPPAGSRCHFSCRRPGPYNSRDCICLSLWALDPKPLHGSGLGGPTGTTGDLGSRNFTRGLTFCGPADKSGRLPCIPGRHAYLIVYITTK
jgi:hypothetical protein